ncbi:ATP-binding protein [Uliginosibacterium sp. 31-16]|uniref:AlbA family DNA-binding domain-containing protein n=1 Tax=Uliginosibacterium sp. 31-16 TaxID=3068315 RepID=UPI00273DE19C|nr:ATP-binding protein [Uliginosibacterium sp. 31-16]MDP5241399.1 ATP-binding protein [Uliginosibacterium sp. 31-16]
MVNSELLNVLRYKSEGVDLDFKREQYPFANGSDPQKAEMLKDILAIANAWRDGTGYILLGFKDNRPHPAEVVGISESVDDSRLQQFVNSKVEPKLMFRYEEHLYEGKTVGIIVIPKQKRPFSLTKDYGGLRRHIAYVRRGSSTDEAALTEVSEMTLADSGRGQVLLNLSVLTPDNEPLPRNVALKYLSFPKKLADYKSPPSERPGPYEFALSVRRYDNEDFWREYAEYVSMKAALIEMKFTLINSSQTPLSNAKLEVSVKPLDGQSFRMMAGEDIPSEPSETWDALTGVRSLPELLDQRDALLGIDESGEYPICNVRFGSLLPGEEGRSSDTLAIVPSGPGKLQLNFRILAGELAEPQQSEQLLETTGEQVCLDVPELKEMRGQALLARYERP